MATATHHNRHPRPATFRLPPDDPDLMIALIAAGEMIGLHERSLRSAIKSKDPKSRLRAIGGGYGKKVYVNARDLRLWILGQRK